MGVASRMKFSNRVTPAGCGLLRFGEVVGMSRLSNIAFALSMKVLNSAIRSACMLPQAPNYCLVATGTSKSGRGQGRPPEPVGAGSVPFFNRSSYVPSFGHLLIMVVFSIASPIVQ
jgi:hypothetical protein